jgi:hypothetical protein
LATAGIVEAMGEGEGELSAHAEAKDAVTGEICKVSHATAKVHVSKMSGMLSYPLLGVALSQ